MLTIGAEERRKLKDNVRLLRQYRMFQSVHLKNNTLEKVFQYMKTVKFRHGHVAYRESAGEIDGLYFIKNGDFEVSQTID